MPADGRFGSGPSKVRAEAIAALADPVRSPMGTSHRQEPVRRLVGRIRAGLRTLWDLPADHRVVLGNGGSTAFWDVATAGLIQRRSQHLVFGEFGAKFAAGVGAAPFVESPDLIEVPAGERAHAVGRAGVDLYALTHNETSTGVLGDIARPDGADPGALVTVDATSAAGAVAFDPKDVDAYYFAPQKCFASDGGLWVAVLSPAAVERAGHLGGAGGGGAGGSGGHRWVPPSLDLPAAIEQSERNQTVNTPAIATLVLFVEQLDWMLDNGGMDFTIKRTETSAACLYGWAEASRYATPFVSDAEARSPVVGTIDFDAGVPAATVAAVLRSNGIVDTEPYRKLGRNQLRIGMYPAVDPTDVEALTACIDYVIGAL